MLIVPDESTLTYNRYLKVPELLELQQPQSNPAHHDEMLFIVIHQAYELWFKLCLHEIGTAQEHLRAGRALRARHFVQRVVGVMRVLVQQIHILDTMQPVDFLQFRDHLTPASGFQSGQFREFEFRCGLKEPRYLSYFETEPEVHARLEQALRDVSLREDFLEWIAKSGLSLKEIYQHPEQHSEYLLLCESLVDLDQELGLWREHHVRVVERLIGFKMGTGGSTGVGYLKSTTSKKCFPELWDIRGELTK